MQAFVADPRLLTCGDFLFESGRVVHDGNTWVWTFEAVEPKQEIKV